LRLLLHLRIQQHNALPFLFRVDDYEFLLPLQFSKLFIGQSHCLAPSWRWQRGLYQGQIGAGRLGNPSKN
jgi:hypothetical protein